MNLSPYFPNLLPDLREVRCETSVHNAAQHVSFLGGEKKRGREGRTFLMGVYGITFTRVLRNDMTFRE
jgi:hypothetical protein